MTTRWYVHKDNQAHGPYTAAELRASLREGRFDPFDHVNREGSKVRLELVEVDEIFTDEKPDLSITTPLVANAPAPGMQPGTQPSPKPITAYQPAAPRPKPAQAFVPQQKPKPNNNGGSSRRDTKKFFLQDRKKRLLGPLSGREIEALYSRGRLDNAVKVFKNGGSKGIPIIQFVAAYAGAKYTELNEMNDHGMAVTKPAEGLPNSRVMEELTRAVALQGMTKSSGPWVTFAGLMVGIAAAYFVAKQYVLPRIDRDGGASWNIVGDETGNVQAPQQQPSASLEPIVIQPVAPVTPTPAPVSIKATKPKTVTPKPRSTSSSSSVYSAPRPQPRMPVYTPPPTPVRASQTPPVQRQQQQVAARPPSSGARISQLVGKEGTLVTIGPLAFNPAELASCGMKCNLVFRDQFGGTLTAVFFKAKYESTLKSKRGAASIRGNLANQGGKLIIYLESVL